MRGIWRAAIGLLVGAVASTLSSQQLDRLAEGHREEDHGSAKLDKDAAAQDAAPSAAFVSGSARWALLASRRGRRRQARIGGPLWRAIGVQAACVLAAQSAVAVPRP
jgi:hypothetical protein